jgi:DNA repair exonuclease SbcCD ATPase subunit
VRPLTRRWGSNDLETARRVVSAAEREALDRAEQLRLEAEVLLQASVAQRAEEERHAREQVMSEVAGLRAELEQVTTRATEAEAEVQRLHTEWEHNGRPERHDETGYDMPPEETTTDDLDDDAARPALTLVRDDASPIDASYLADFVAQMATEAERLVQAAQAAAIQLPPEPANAETDQLLKSALAAIERDTVAASNLVAEAEEERTAAEELRHQAQREHRAASVAREEAQNQLHEARAEAERVLADACASRDQMVKVREELTAQLVSLRDAMDVIRDSLNRFISEGGPAREAIDLRELTDLGQRQRRI